MHILFLGTGQKERIPIPYHKDKICTEARKQGAKENRTQASILISQDNTFLLFDCTEHFLEQIKRESIDIDKLTAVFATDEHEESIGGLHFLDNRLHKKVNFYSSGKTAERVKERFRDLKNIKIKGLEDEKTIEVGKISVTPFEISSSIQKRCSVLAYQIRGKNAKVVYSKNTADVPEDKRHYYRENDCLIVGGAIRDVTWFTNFGNKLEIFTWVGHSSRLHSETEEFVKNEYKKHQAKGEISMAHDGLRLSLGSEESPSTREKLIEAKKILDEDSGAVLIPEKIAKQKPKWAIYEIPPFGKLIWEGKKTLIVRDVKLAKHIKEPLLLCSGEYVYGVVVLEQGIEIDLKKFEELRNKHFVSDALRKSLWSDSEKLYIYDFHFEKLDNIIKFKKVKGFKDFINISKIKFAEKGLDLEDWVTNFTLLPDKFLKNCIEKLTPKILSNLSRESLICFHGKLHYLWGNLWDEEALSSAHHLVIQEFKRREPVIRHEIHCDLDRISEDKDVAKGQSTNEISVYGKTFSKIFNEDGGWSLDEKI